MVQSPNVILRRAKEDRTCGIDIPSCSTRINSRFSLDAADFGGFIVCVGPATLVSTLRPHVATVPILRVAIRRDLSIDSGRSSCPKLGSLPAGTPSSLETVLPYDTLAILMIILRNSEVVCSVRVEVDSVASYHRCALNLVYRNCLAQFRLVAEEVIVGRRTDVLVLLGVTKFATATALRSRLSASWVTMARRVDSRLTNVVVDVASALHDELSRRWLK